MSHIEDMESMIETLSSKAKSQLDGNMECVNTEEMGEVIDMIKDLAEAKYKCIVTKAMKDAEKEDELMSKLGITPDDSRRGYDNYRYRSTGKYAPTGRGTYEGNSRYGYGEPMMGYDSRYPYENYRDMDRDSGRMYYTGGGPGNSGMNSSSMTSSGSNSGGGAMRSYTESRYDRARRNYTETKEMHNSNSTGDKEEKMKSLENYMTELGTDITDMIKDSTPEEKALLRQKLTLLTQKI